MVSPITLRRGLRIARNAPNAAWRSWRGAFLNEGQFVSLALAGLTSWVGLQTASIPEVIEEATAWGNAVQALVYVALGWAALCLLRSPWQVHAEDARIGSWHGNRFVYDSPMLAETFRVRPTGNAEMYKFNIPHVEPGAFVYAEAEVEGPGNLAKVAISGFALVGPIQYLAGRSFGFLLPKGSRRAILTVELPTNAIAATVRVRCTSFTLGNPEDQDGDTGNHKFPLRQPPKGNDRP